MPFNFQDLIEVILLESYNVRLVVISTMLLGITSGLIGSFLLMRKRSLMGDALSHATLPGIGIAFAIMVLMGGSGKFLPGLLLGASISGVIGVLVMLAIINTTRLREDVAMGFVLSVFFGFGVAILQLVKDVPGGHAAGLESFIYGKAASIVFQDSILIGGIALITSISAVLLRKEFTLLCFDDTYAASQGWPVLWLDILMLGLVTAVTVIGLQAVGLILVIAFLIIPAATARFWTHRLDLMLLLSAIIGGISGWLGASLSALLPRLPAGAVIVLVAATIFLASMLFGTARGVIPRLMDQARLKRRVGRQHLLRAAYEILEYHHQPAINLPISRDSMLEHRAWTPRQFKRLLGLARREDHLEPSAPGTIRLSESGFGEATRITRNHRLWELYLIRHADIAPSHVDRDADMVEHILGAEIVRQLEAELEPQSEIPASPHTI
ncbi:iron chelate uptake ABC transporter family permease subunit [Haloferula sp.]|uniref:metal ABC transporter permease n=1 Tax=Haloferula sp. TaxID=2497595 RepID=UPI0032A05356